jgi:hypothetical protein
VLAKTYHIILAYTTLILEAKYLIRLKAIGNLTISQPRLSGRNSKPSVKSWQKIPEHTISLFGSLSTSYAEITLQPVLEGAP